MSILEWIAQGSVYYFVVFSSAVWCFWGYKMWLRRGYAPVAGNFNGTASILIPTYKEAPFRLIGAVIYALQQNAHQVIVIVDYREPETVEFLVGRFGDTIDVITCPAGKRNALAEGIAVATGEIIVVTASDTKLTNGTVSRLLAPFQDANVGGVCGYTRPHIGTFQLATWIYFWITEMRAKLTYRALSNRDQVQVLDGECFAVRRTIWLKLMDRYLNQRFMGVTPQSGDDGWITTLLIEDGWKTKYQEDAYATTFAPSSIIELTRQQLRWNRNSVRRGWYLISGGVAFKRGAPLTIHTLANLLKTPIFATLIFLSLLQEFDFIRGGGDSISIGKTGALMASAGTVELATFLFSISLTRAIRAIPRYSRKRLLPDLLGVPIYALVGLFLLMPLRIYATLTPRRIEWGTRGPSSWAQPSGLVSQFGTAAAFVISLMIPFGLVVLLIGVLLD